MSLNTAKCLPRGQDYPQLRTNVELKDPGIVEAEGKRRPARARMGCCPGRDAHRVGLLKWQEDVAQKVWRVQERDCWTSVPYRILVLTCHKSDRVIRPARALHPPCTSNCEIDIVGLGRIRIQSPDGSGRSSQSTLSVQEE